MVDIFHIIRRNQARAGGIGVEQGLRMVQGYPSPSPRLNIIIVPPLYTGKTKGLHMILIHHCPQGHITKFGINYSINSTVKRLIFVIPISFPLFKRNIPNEWEWNKFHSGYQILTLLIYLGYFSQLKNFCLRFKVGYREKEH